MPPRSSTAAAVPANVIERIASSRAMSARNVASMAAASKSVRAAVGPVLGAHVRGAENAATMYLDPEAPLREPGELDVKICIQCPQGRARSSAPKCRLVYVSTADASGRFWSYDREGLIGSGGNLLPNIEPSDEPWVWQPVPYVTPHMLRHAKADMEDTLSRYAQVAVDEAAYMRNRSRRVRVAHTFSPDEISALRAMVAALDGQIARAAAEDSKRRVHVEAIRRGSRRPL